MVFRPELKSMGKEGTLSQGMNYCKCDDEWMVEKGLVLKVSDVEVELTSL